MKDNIVKLPCEIGTTIYKVFLEEIVAYVVCQFIKFIAAKLICVVFRFLREILDKQVSLQPKSVIQYFLTEKKQKGS